MIVFSKKKTFESSFLSENKSYKVFFLQNLDFTKSFFSPQQQNTVMDVRTAVLNP